MSNKLPINEETGEELKPGEVVLINEIPASGQLASLVLSPMQQMQQAHSMGMSVDEMKDMLALQKEYEANEARKAFHVALAEFKKNPPQVVKDKLNQKYGSNYVSIGNMVNTVNEAMGPFGLNSRWDYPEKEDDKIYVTCILSHTMGHEEKVTISGPPDTEGSKNVIQQRKAARTYLKLETFEAVTGMASIEGNVDDDGNSTGNQAPPEIKIISDTQVKAIEKKLKDHDLETGIFTKWIAKKFPYTKGSVQLLAAEHYAMTNAKLDESIKLKAKKG